MVRRMKFVHLLIPLAIACSHAPVTATNVAMVTSPPASCYDPVAYGAIPNDLVDDRAPMQAALDAASVAGGTWCLGPGRWEVSRAPTGSYNRFAALATHGQHVVMRGAGPSTIISLRGDQGMATTWVIALDPSASDITISDMTIDTSFAYNTEEQTHAIEVGTGVCSGALCAPIEDVKIEHVRIVHPWFLPPPQLKGDCLRLIGVTPVTAVRRVQVLGSSFLGCARSGIAIQRGVHDLIIEGNEFTAAGDQDIDAEPTGDATAINDTTLITGNVFHDVGGQGDFSLAWGGALTPAGRAIISGNIFEGRGINVYRASDVAITGNVIRATATSEYGTINVGHTITRLLVEGNVVTRAGYVGALIRVTHQSGNYAKDVTIANNVMQNDTAGPGVYLESVSDAVISGNVIRWSVPATFGLYLRTTIAALDGLVMVGNKLESVGLTWGIYLAASPNPIESVTLVGNQIRGATTGLKCDSSTTGLYHSTFTQSANKLGSIACPSYLP